MIAASQDRKNGKAHWASSSGACSVLGMQRPRHELWSICLASIERSQRQICSPGSSRIMAWTQRKMYGYSFPAHMASSSLWQILIDTADPGNRLNTRQATSLIRTLIAGFRAAGLKPGDAVCVHAFNSILYPILYFGIIGAGGVCVGSNPAYKTLELSHLLSITEPKFFIVEEALSSDVLSTVEDLIPRTRTFILSTRNDEFNPDGCRSLGELLQHGERDWIRINDTKTAKSTIAVLQSTSGTTGLPKAAATSHYALVAAGVAMQESGQRQYEVTRLISLPLFHSFGASFVHIAAFRY
ncbi:hypothetical protein E4T44_10711, partial [Aureobasidium sp. EXF-8845]